MKKSSVGTKKGRAIDGGGLFGTVVAYTSGVETQGGATLHFHGLVWLANFPATFKEEDAWK